MAKLKNQRIFSNTLLRPNATHLSSVRNECYTLDDADAGDRVVMKYQDSFFIEIGHQKGAVCFLYSSSGVKQKR